MDQGQAHDHWYCCKSMLQNTLYCQRNTGVDRKDWVKLYSFFLAGIENAVIGDLDGHPEGPLDFVVEVKKGLKDLHPQPDTSYYYFAQDLAAGDRSDNPWYGLKVEEWNGMKLAMEKTEVCVLYCKEDDIEHGFAIWELMPEEETNPIAQGESVSAQGSVVSVAATTMSHAEARRVRHARERRQSMASGANISARQQSSREEEVEHSGPSGLCSLLWRPLSDHQDYNRVIHLHNTNITTMLSNDNHNNFQSHGNITMDRPLETQSAPPSPSFKTSFRSNRRATSLDLDLPRLKSSTATTELIFCCEDCINSIKEEDIDNFGQIGSTCPPFQGSVRSITLKHVIVIAPITKNPKPNNPKKPVRYYAYLERANEYREIDSILFTYLQDVGSFNEETTKARFTCKTHGQTYNLIRYTSPHSESDSATEYFSESDTETSSPQSETHSSSGDSSVSGTEGPSPESLSDSTLECSSESDIEDREYESNLLSSLSLYTTEAYGTSVRALSPYQLSVEKRRFMIRKLSYGRKDQMEEIINSAVISDEDRGRRDRWGWQGRRHKKEAQEMLDFEMRYCLGKMRMFFLDGRVDSA
ncbi:hypothetical protein BDZ45DRAFT_807316 [Acephala macrosclerotiorum]|nr:hypothetical protein BDZ45DRAFT_807316 [Acephala macrosclerotiorum]